MKIQILLFLSAVNSLRCLQCIGSASSCRMVARKCQAYETTCISLAYRSTAGSTTSNTVMKGCSTRALCNQTSVIDTGNRSIYMSASCCETDYCNINRYSTKAVFSNRMQCYTCKNNNLYCGYPNLDKVFCDGVDNWCVDVLTKEYTNGKVTASAYSKGCGSGEACNSLLAFDTGSFQRYTQYSCCNSQTLCNDAYQSTTQILNNINGITCWACLDTGNNECDVKNQVQISCKGTLIRCMEAYDQNRKVVMKGCSTVTYCSATYPSLNVPNISEIQCCAGSNCNNFTQMSTTSEINGAWSPSTDVRLLILLFTLLCTLFCIVDPN
ncbi:urokinase plasminogen activator surface receptor-like [Xenopus laevis]|uniref:Urokinase plasminogen activator surface receptor-like n=1 Tax=Xenopus laevis TaxID=8355 RepID=A0A8J1LFX6_XENLA|nr:urokinase plasminogen activator surface receptor-like [Xenopus laevis]